MSIFYQFLFLNNISLVLFEIIRTKYFLSLRVLFVT